MVWTSCMRGKANAVHSFNFLQMQGVYNYFLYYILRTKSNGIRAC